MKNRQFYKRTLVGIMAVAIGSGIFWEFLQQAHYSSVKLPMGIFAVLILLVGIYLLTAKSMRHYHQPKA